MSKTTYESLDNKIAASTLTKDLTKGLDVVDGHGIKKPGEYENPDELYDMLIARIRKYHPSTDCLLYTSRCVLETGYTPCAEQRCGI